MAQASKEYFISNNWIPIDNAKVTITNLVHITHSANAKQIISPEGIEFKASRKRGRENKSSYKLKEPHEEHLLLSDIRKKKKANFVVVGEEKSLICPGYFSWWGIKVNSATSSRLKCPNHYLSQQFTKESYYGTVGISVPFDVVIDSYKNSFGPGNVLFKKAGSLLYTQEVCHVILVCVQERGKGDPLPQFSTVPEYTAGSSVCITHPYSWIEGSGSVKWDHYVFAFYFPNDHATKSFTLIPCTVKLFQTKHKKEWCLGKKCQQDQWQCPDNDVNIADNLRSLQQMDAGKMYMIKFEENDEESDDDENDEENDDESSDSNDC